jgi:hypothetical protein
MQIKIFFVCGALALIPPLVEVIEPARRVSLDVLTYTHALANIHLIALMNHLKQTDFFVILYTHRQLICVYMFTSQQLTFLEPTRICASRQSMTSKHTA